MLIDIKKTPLLTTMILSTTYAYAANDSVPRIIGGISTDAQSWMVAIGSPQNNKWKNFCGGTLIDKDWVLTAAHCLEDTQLTGLQVAIGVSDLNKSPTRHVVDQVVIHETYLTNYLNTLSITDAEGDSDIALLHLRSSSMNAPLRISEKSANDFVKGISSFTTWGYGGIDPDSTLSSSQLLKVNLSFEGFRDLWYRDPTRTHIFAGNIPGKDSCSGDSGGPLTDDSGLVGVTSYGGNKCGAGTPGAYTFAPMFRDWVAQQTNNVSITSHQLVEAPAGQHTWIGFTVLNPKATPVELVNINADTPAMRSECPQFLGAGAKCKIKLRFDANFTPETFKKYQVNLTAINSDGSSKRLNASLVGVTKEKSINGNTVTSTDGSTSTTTTTSSVTSTSSSSGGGSFGLFSFISLLSIALVRRFSIK